LIVARLFAALAGGALFAVLLHAEPPKPRPPAATPAQREADLKEEDEELTTPHEYAFNPLQADKEMKVGDFYWKKGSFKAAMRRYEEATKWNPQSGDAWLKYGDACERMKDLKNAREAWKKYLELEPSGKRAGSVRKKLEKKS
jgi:tetratricopeptide (TPR) repeat protein